MIALASALLVGPLVTAQVSERELRSISTPDKGKTSIGELKFFDGVPTDDTVKKEQARNRSGKVLVHDPPDVWPARALDQQDLAPE